MLKYGYWLIIVGYATFFASYSTQDIDYPTLNQNWSYCFEYTWIGPEYDNITGYNGTCDDYKDDTRAGDNIPCSPPFVVSYDGSIPDVEYLWNNHKASVLCRRSASQACVIYTYWYNGLVTNQTHMCARVRTDSKTMPSACYTQKENGYDIQLCICTSGYGLNKMPCNAGSGLQKITLGTIVFALLIKWCSQLL